MGNRICGSCGGYQRLTDGNARNSRKPWALAVTPDSSEYTGSYGKLMYHFKACKQNKLISEDELEELQAALETLAHPEGLLDAEAMRRLSGSNLGDTVLPAFGFGQLDGWQEQSASSPSTTSEVCCSRDGFFDAAAAVFLRDVNFNCRGSTDRAQQDFRMLMSGFRMDLTDRYKIDPNILNEWIRAIAAQYLQNPYHNWMHAVDVFQFCHMSLFEGGGEEFLTYTDILSVLIGTIGHDVGHPGTTNPFLVNSRSHLALTYNDKSPLENMHASLVFQTHSRPGKNFLDPLPEQDFRKVRSRIIDVILATDMVHHFSMVDKLSARVAREDSEPFPKGFKEDGTKNKASLEDRRNLIESFVHMADIGNGCRPWHVCKNLVVSLEEEFFNQGDQERQLGIPIMPMMDRTKDSLAMGQDFFLTKLVQPLLDNFCHFISPSLRDSFKGALQENRQKWSEMIEKHGKKSAKELLALCE